MQYGLRAKKSRVWMNMKTKSKKAKAESANYLDYVPMHNEDKYPFQTEAYE